MKLATTFENSSHLADNDCAAMCFYLPPAVANCCLFLVMSCQIMLACSSSLAFAIAFAKRGPHVDASFRAVTQDLLAHPNNAAMYSTRNAILHFHVQLGEHEGLIHACIANVSLGGRVHNVAYLEALHSLVLWHTPPAVAAANNRCVTTTVLAAPIVAALGRHDAVGISSGPWIHKAVSQT